MIAAVAASLFALGTALGGFAVARRELTRGYLATRPASATIELDGVTVPADAVVAAPGKAAAVLDTALPAILTVVAADLCGAAEWQLQTTAEYARVRSQFGRPIGFFQAVKHPIVNMMCAIDRARSLTYAAASAVDNDPKDALRLARMAKAAVPTGPVA